MTTSRLRGFIGAVRDRLIWKITTPLQALSEEAQATRLLLSALYRETALTHPRYADEHSLARFGFK
ncbi:MAG: hypothetical protein ACRD1T_23770, partial [Acidimicrobiia bacterium]